MATVRMTLGEAAAGGTVDHEFQSRVTDQDIGRHAREDGDDADQVHDDWYPSPAALRQRLRITQTAISERLLIPVATWRNREQGRVVPDPAARAPLTILWRFPQAVEARRVDGGADQVAVRAAGTETPPDIAPER